MPGQEQGVASVTDISAGSKKGFESEIGKLKAFNLHWESINRLFECLRECDRQFPDETMDFIMTSLVNGKVKV